MSNDLGHGGMFDPLNGAERKQACGGQRSDSVESYRPVVPVPEGAPEPDWERLKPQDIEDPLVEGPPTTWSYQTRDGAEAFRVARWETRSGGKEFRPATWNGKEWVLKAMPDSRPLYGLPALLQSNDKPVVVVEGEKCADAAAPVFPGRTVTTWAGGAKAWRKTDWQSLVGREVLLVSDADDTGREAMRDIAGHLASLECTVRIYLPEGDDKKDIADWLEESLNAETVATRIEADASEWDKIGGYVASAPPWQRLPGKSISPSSVDEPGTTDVYASLIEDAKKAPGILFRPDTLEWLVNLPQEEWINLRFLIKQNCKDVPLAELDRAIRAHAEDDAGDNLQGHAIEWSEVKPWANPVDGALLLDEIAELIRRYVVMPDGMVDGVALWIGHTWIHHSLGISTFLNITSATKRCGKSLLLEVIAELVPRPSPVSGLTTGPTLFRFIERDEPTLLLDEADTYLKNSEGLRGIINGSQRRDIAKIMRTVGTDYEPQCFSTWCPKVICGIGGLPDTVLDRSIIIRLERRPARTGDLPKWRDRDRQAIEDMKRKLVRWTADNINSILTQRNDVTFPPKLHDRACDAWEALLAIGDAAGREWAGSTGRAWQACEAISADTQDETGPREMLLADLWRVFGNFGDPKTMGTAQIIDELVKMEARPWSEWRGGKQLSPRGLANLLKDFKISPGTIGGKAKGYKREQFTEVWKNYGIESS